MNMNNGNKMSVTKSLDIGQMSAFASMKTLIEAKRTFKKVTKKEKKISSLVTNRDISVNNF